jgi:IclR family pca regulon transcriptional regulator
MPRVRRSATEQSIIDAYGPDFLESLARGLRVIRAFGAERRQMTLSDIAKLVDLPRATARRTLYTLEKLGYAESDGRVFRLTPHVLALASSYLASDSLSIVLQPAMDRMASEAQEVCSVAILERTEVVFVARASPARVFLNGLEIGYRLPAASSSVGRVQLGRFSEPELDAWLAEATLRKLTPQTITDKCKLKRLILRDAAQGYSIVDQEAEPGFRSISVPIRRYDGGIVAAMNIGAHVDRISVERMEEAFLPLLRRTAAEVRPLLL